MIRTRTGRASPTAELSPQRVVVLLGAGTAISLLGDSTLYTVLPRAEVAAEVGISLTTVGVLLGLNRVIRLLTNGAAGVLYDRFPRRSLLVGSLLLGGLSTLVFAVGRGPALLILSRLMWGAAWSGIWVGGNAVVLDVASPENRGRLSGAYQMWFFLGTGGAALIGALLTDLVGFRQGLLVGGALTIAAGLFWLMLLPGSRGHRSAHAPNPRDPSTAPFPWAPALFAAVPMFVTRFVFAGVISATTILWLTSLAGDRLPLAGLTLPIATATGAFVAVRALVSVSGAGLAGHVSDWTGRRWIIVAGALLAGAAGLWLAASPNIPFAVAGALGAAVTAGGVQAMVPAITGDRGSVAQRGRMLSIVYTLGDLGSALGPLLALWLIQQIPIGEVYRGCALLLGLVALFALAQELRGAARDQPGGEAQALTYDERGD